jgi:hypothetical protein
LGDQLDISDSLGGRLCSYESRSGKKSEDLGETHRNERVEYRDRNERRTLDSKRWEGSRRFWTLDRGI